MPEEIGKNNPAEVFSAAVSQRQAELDYLTAGLRAGLELIGDLDQVNAIIAASSRPDLLMAEPIEMMPVEHPYNLGGINNFVPNMCAFGMPVYEMEDDVLGGSQHRVVARRRQPTREELDEYFFLGARGGYDDYLAFGDENGIDRERVKDVLLQTHAPSEAFMRMWILFPELTETLMASCLTDGENKSKGITEEIFVAYSIMSRLVDRNDRGAVKGDGSIDTWLLCH